MENKTVLLTTSTCTFCPMVKGAIEAENLDIEYVDVEENPEIATAAMVMSVPTIVVIKDEEFETHVGHAACMEFINE